MTSVFISHASGDDEQVRSLIVDPLTRLGFNIWYSRDSIHGADEWEKQIRQSLIACEWFLVALSPRSVQSRWVQAEVDWAIESRWGKIVPVLIDDCDPQECHLRLRQIQFIDLRHNNPSGQNHLLKVWDRAPTALAPIARTEQAIPPVSPRTSVNPPASARDLEEEPENIYAPYSNRELLQIRKKIASTLQHLQLGVIEYTEATMPFTRVVEIRDLQEKLDLVNQELASRA